MLLFLTDESPYFIHLQSRTGQIAHGLIHQMGATYPDPYAEAHDGIAVDAGHALDGPDTASFRESCNHRDLFIGIESIRHQRSPDG
jgi:hypothetical protein